MKLDSQTAHEILVKTGTKGKDFHALHSSKVDDLLMYARKYKFRKSKTSPGSTGRAFHAHLEKKAKYHNEETIMKKKGTLKESVIAHLMSDPDVHATAVAAIGGYAPLYAMDKYTKYKEKKAARVSGKKLTAGMSQTKADHPPKPSVHTKIKHFIKKKFAKEEDERFEALKNTKLTEERFVELVEYMFENYDANEVIELLEELAQ